MSDTALVRARGASGRRVARARVRASSENRRRHWRAARAASHLRNLVEFDASHGTAIINDGGAGYGDAQARKQGPFERGAGKCEDVEPLGDGAGAQHRCAAIREFGARTDGLFALTDWLLACGVDAVALESTGV